jgi:hypothetical protein
MNEHEQRNTIESTLGASRSIYFIRSGKNGPIKIGLGTPSERLKSLQTGNPEELFLIGVIPNGGLKKELELHEMFREYNIRGEWFEPCDELLGLIDSLKVNSPAG